NSTSLTKEMLLVVPSMAVRMVDLMWRLACSRGSGSSRELFGLWPLLQRKGQGSRLKPLPPGRSGLVGLVFVARDLPRDVGAGEMPDPAVRLGEETDRHEARLRAHVEPVGGAVGHSDQVVLHAFDLVHPVAHVQGEQPRAGAEEAHPALLVGVL